MVQNKVIREKDEERRNCPCQQGIAYEFLNQISSNLVILTWMKQSLRLILTYIKRNKDMLQDNQA